MDSSRNLTDHLPLRAKSPIRSPVSLLSFVTTDAVSRDNSRHTDKSSPPHLDVASFLRTCSPFRIATYSLRTLMRTGQRGGPERTLKKACSTSSDSVGVETDFGAGIPLYARCFYRIKSMWQESTFRFKRVDWNTTGNTYNLSDCRKSVEYIPTCGMDEASVLMAFHLHSSFKYNSFLLLVK
nr:unnamed protein product [Fasciola hepatica]